MEVLSAIVTAISLGAAEGLKSSANQAVTVAYGALKTYLANHYGSIDLTKIEKKPRSEGQKKVLHEELQETPAAEDKQLLEYVRNVLECVSNSAPSSGAVLLEDIRAVRNVILTNIVGEGPTTIRRVDAGKDFRADGLFGKSERFEPPKKA